MVFETSSQEYFKKIGELNEALSKLEKSHKKMENDPKVEEQLQYYRAQIESSNSKLENKEKALNDKLEAYTAKIENEIKILRDKNEEYIKYCNINIEKRENPSNKLYDIEKEDIVKERNYYIHAHKEAEEMEQSITRQIRAMEAKKNPKELKYMYNGKEYTKREYDIVVHREIMKKQLDEQSTDSESDN